MRATTIIGLVVGGALGYFNAIGANDLSWMLLQDRWGRGCAFGHDLRLAIFSTTGAAFGGISTRVAVRQRRRR